MSIRKILDRYETFYYLKDSISSGCKQDYLFTKDELIVARQRALKNRDIIPKKWFDKFF